MADRNITITIEDRKYCLKASSEDKEEAIRRAAQIVNSKIAYYKNAFSGRSEVDLLSFVALNECINNIGLEKAIDAIKAEARGIESQLEGYVENIGNSRQ